MSKTVWLAIIQALIAAIVVLETSFPGVGWLLVVKSAADIILRMLTVAPIGSFIRDPEAQ